ncbi:MAG: hypothetical protein QOE86_2664 [Solirubrobacteraceae bacterium]|nr:hypothetical protein [Solirubrobacteraceae bacterium]
MTSILSRAIFAHGIVGRADLPIPATYFGVAAAIVLVISFASLAVGWTRPRLETVTERPLFRLPFAVEVVLGAVGVAVFAVAVYAGLAGTDIETENLAPTVIYVIFWVGVPVLSLVAGDVWRLLSPWRVVGRAVGALVQRAGGEDAAEPLPYPARLGRWPAFAGIVGFALVELCWGRGTEPTMLAILALVYFAVQVVGMGLYGVEPWTRNGDAFGVYFGLFAALSPIGRRPDGTVVLRSPLSGAPHVARPPGTVALLCAGIGSTTFDGAKEGPLFGSIVPHLQDFFTGIGLSKGAALEWTFVVGLVVCIALVAALYGLGVLGMGGDLAVGERARAFVHTLIPIAAAYVVAHYFSLLAYQGQAAWWLASDPLGDGSDWFGTAGGTIDYSVVSATAIWYVQVAALVIGHVSGLVLAHDRALALYRSPRGATRSQIVMLVVMVAFTSLGLWLLSVSNS